jgi:hypothetical protein
MVFARAEALGELTERYALPDGDVEKVSLGSTFAGIEQRKELSYSLPDSVVCWRGHNSCARFLL